MCVNEYVRSSTLDLFDSVNHVRFIPLMIIQLHTILKSIKLEE